MCFEDITLYPKSEKVYFGKSSLHLPASFLLVIEQVGLLGTVTQASNYWFFVALLLMMSLCQVLLGGDTSIFHLDDLGCFLVLINYTMPLGAQSIFKKLNSVTESLTRKVLP